MGIEDDISPASSGGAADEASAPSPVPQESAPAPPPFVTLTESQLESIMKNAIKGALQAQQLIKSTPAPSVPSQPNTRRPDRPTIGMDCSEARWAFFKEEWELYKSAVPLTGDAPGELRQCCTEDLRLALFEYIGPSIRRLQEEELMEKICLLAVQSKNVAVHRQEFYHMHQEDGQTAQQFIAKLKAKSEHCSFVVKCPSGLCSNTKISYALPMVADILTVGCYDKDIQGELLAKSATVRTLEEKFQLVQALESGIQAKRDLGSESSVTAQRSSYKKSSNTRRNNQQQKGCSGCGSTAHGPGTELLRKEHCPARSVECNYCHIVGHYESACRKKKNNSTVVKPQNNSQQVSNNSGITTTLSATAQDDSSTLGPEQGYTWLASAESPDEHRFISHCHTMNSSRWQSSGRLNHKLSHRVIIPHMEWDSLSNQFRNHTPRPMPTLSVHIEPLRAAHASFKRPIPPTATSTKSEGLADTGAQTCASGPQILNALGIKQNDLIPTSHHIRGVTKSHLDIQGVLLAKISAGDHCTNQVIYICNNTSGLYLSQQALRDLKCIPKTFPNQDESSIQSLNSGDSPVCSCPSRSDPPVRPKQMPYPPTEENRERLQTWILDYFKSSAFNTCQHQPLPHMDAQPLKVNFKPDAVPHAHHRPIPVPHHWKDQVKADLDRDVCLGIIEPVPPGTPTIWCSKMVVVAKKDGTPRRTVDLQNLNAASYRETHHTSSPFNLASSVPSGTRKTILDAWNAYHLVPLSEEARDATTFITEWGRYRYCRGPQGFKASGDAFTKAYYDMTIDVQRKAQCVDDTILWDNDITSSFWHTIDYLILCCRKGVVFNPKKFLFAQNEIEFAGFVISRDGLKPSHNLLEAIETFPTPKCITDARSWFGLVNQVSYSLSTSDTMLPFRDLLKPGPWYWDDALDIAFKASKEAILKVINIGVRSFQPDRPTCICTDWSKTGLGFTLLQKHCRCGMGKAPHCCKDGWRLVFAGSRFTTPAESRYAPVEGEALAVAYALDKCRMFTLGCNDLTVATDHKPLVKILGDGNLDSIKNPRIFSFKERTLQYKYTIKHVPGAGNHAPDACSRRPRPTHDTEPTLLTSIRAEQVQEEILPSTFACACAEGEAAASMLAVQECSHAMTMTRVQMEAVKDANYQTLIDICTNGFPVHSSKLSDYLRPFHKLENQLHIINGVVMFGERIVIPSALRKEVLEGLHAAHQGVAGMKARAATCVYWPGISSDITRRRSQCQTCNTIAPSQPRQPLQQSLSPTYPFECVVADYFSLGGHEYLVYADRYTGWVSVAKSPTHGSTSDALIRELRTAFTQYGAPNELATDGGSQFAARATQLFLERWGVCWRLSSAYYPQSNGRAELAVKTAKRLLREHTTSNGDLNTDAVARALLQYRNTPLADIQRSPAQLLYGRQMKDHLPTLEEARRIRPEWIMLAEDRERALSHRHMKQRESYNEHTRPLTPLNIGDHVLVQNQTGVNPNRWDKTGIITEVADHDKYVIRMDGTGRCTLRNRRYIRKFTPFDTGRLPMTNVPFNLSHATISPTSYSPGSDMHPHSNDAPNENVQQQQDTNEIDPIDNTPALPTTEETEKLSIPMTVSDNLTPDKPTSTASKPLDSVQSPEPQQETPATEPRRSSRVRKPRMVFSASLRGKHHNKTCQQSPIMKK